MTDNLREQLRAAVRAVEVARTAFTDKGCKPGDLRLAHIEADMLANLVLANAPALLAALDIWEQLQNPKPVNEWQVGDITGLIRYGGVGSSVLSCDEEWDLLVDE